MAGQAGSRTRESCLLHSGAAEDCGCSQKDVPGHGRMAALAPQELAEVDTVVQNGVKIGAVHKDKRRTVPGVHFCSGRLKAGYSDEQAEGVFSLAVDPGSEDVECGAIGWGVLPLGLNQKVLHVQGEAPVNLLSGYAKGRLWVEVEAIEQIPQERLKGQPARMRLQLEDFRVAVLQFRETLGRRSTVGVLCLCSSDLVACRLSLGQRLLVGLNDLLQPSHRFARRDDLCFVIFYAGQLRMSGPRLVVQCL
jgi:hypothetical protein